MEGSEPTEEAVRERAPGAGPALDAPLWTRIDGASLPERLVGGKARGIQRLLAADLPVPPAACLTTAAFALHLGQPVPAAALRVLGGSDDADEAIAALVEAILAAPLPEALAAALEEAVAWLGSAWPGSPLAVRSSAVGEDAGGASFAGQYLTRLGVAPRDVPRAVRECYASLWSPAAVGYRRRAGADLATAEMAVVLMPLVPAEASAVAFSRDPVLGRRDVLLVEAARGLGEVIVSGEVTPDSIVLDRASLQVRSVTTGGQQWRLRADPSGTPVREPVVDGGSALGDRQLAELGRLVLQAEERLGGPVDVEAAWADDRWWLLQARPITAGVGA
ncbi:MAG TPA: PEP/pyruvate-binding domain-containing protein [Candidatus Limnocylindrales bacterium]|nr:PEP/pyruvate-binding domain-containing protein [Candidatus Limnocylindrales bacterium]